MLTSCVCVCVSVACSSFDYSVMDKFHVGTVHEDPKNVTTSPRCANVEKDARKKIQSHLLHFLHH